MFFVFLRQSNMAPHSVKTYDHTRQLARHDVIIHSDHVEVRLKWSKTMQEGRTPLTLVLARQKGSPICPHAAVSRLYKHYPTVKGKHPLLSFSDGNPMTLEEIGKFFSVTRERIRQYGPPVAIKSQPGDAVIFDCNLLHASGHNLSADDRWQAYLCYNTCANRPDDVESPRPAYVRGTDWDEPLDVADDNALQCLTRL